MKKLIIILSVLILAFVTFFYTPVGTFAFSFFSKQVAGLAQDRFTGEVTITDTHASGDTKYIVWVSSNALTVAGKTYTVYLYFDDAVQASTQTVTWLAGEIPGTVKKVTFTGLSMAGVTEVDPEIR